MRSIFTTPPGGYPRTASIRTYDSLPVVLFGTTYVDNSDNVSPYYAFPAFTQRPSLTYSETFSADAPFGPYVFNTTGIRASARIWRSTPPART